MLINLETILNGAIISPCGKYRFRLWRIWDPSKPLVFWVLHNPSTADAKADDPTVRRCIAFAKAWGYGGIYIGNIYPFRSTDPKALLAVSREERLNEAENCLHMREMYDRCQLRILAHGLTIDKPNPYLISGDFHCLSITKGGYPGHPLYLRSDLQPQPFLPATN